MHLFLIENKLEDKDVTIIDMAASKLPQALADGKVDAISVWEPHIINAVKLLGKNALLLPSKYLFREDFYFVQNKSFLKDHPEATVRFLKAIERGNEFIKENKSEAINIVANRLHVDTAFVSSVWDIYDYKLVLDQSILLVLEQEATWAISNHLVTADKIPNYLDYIYVDALKEVKPNAVTIIK